MGDQQEQLLYLGDDLKKGDTSYILQVLEVFNWGPFSGFHRAEFEPGGTAIIGPTGSGKTTLVDALMTLLVSQPRYNLASTGGHESDRTLISYVRGVLGGDGSDGREEVARPGKTITGICATYTDGEEILRLGGLLWTEGSSNASQDLKRRWLFSLAEDQSLEKWLRLLHDNGVRDLMRMGRETAKLRIFDSKKAYLVHARKFFDVGENALTLLNRAAGLKQLNSIDEIFRDLVLDDRAAFDRALEVAGEFDNLVGIHTELEMARQQQESLVPVADNHRKLVKLREKVNCFQTLKRIVSVWYAITGEQRWFQVLDQIARDRKRVVLQLSCVEREEKDCQSRVDMLRERYFKLGGNVIGELENTIKVQQERVEERRRCVEDYHRMVSLFGLNKELSNEALLYNQALISEKHEEIQKLHDNTQEELLASLSKQRDKETKTSELESAIRKVKDRPGSNIPPKYQDFRAELAEELDLLDSDLPFLAELIEVKPNEAKWRGAIERAIGSERLRILVPEKKLEIALHWVNSRDNRLHVRLQRARSDMKPVQFFSDGFTRKLNFKSHPLRMTAEQVLSKRDLHCVASSKALRDIEHGLTLEGMMSGRRGKFEKQDQFRLNENWMTGFDNKDQLKSLSDQLIELSQSVKQLKVISKQHQSNLSRFNEQLMIVKQLIKLEFSTIDLPEAESDLSRSQERIALLLDPKSDASEAKSAYESELEKLEAIRQRISDSQREIARLESECSHADDERKKAIHRIGDGLTEKETALAEKELPIASEIEANQLDVAERQAAGDVDKELDEQLRDVTEQERRLVRLMEAARRIDTGALAETGSELEDIPDYLDRLRVLNEEALPEKLNRFLEYLNRSSDQGVTQLLSGIKEEVDEIEHRIANLNQTLVKVDYRSGRYLQLQIKRIKHERLRSLESAMRRLRDAALKDDQGESHYKALRGLVEILRDAGQNRRQQGSRALLDPRYRLQFFVVEVDRQTGNQSPPRTGSQSGSGGEKELMASHILTASLSYALCPPEASRPRYGTVILDEAFSKSSPSAAGRIIEALRIFNLHPIFVTPNKEISLLKQHTRKAICVQRPNKEASLASISWEKLEGLARPK